MSRFRILALVAALVPMTGPAVAQQPPTRANRVQLHFDATEADLQRTFKRPG